MCDRQEDLRDKLLQGACGDMYARLEKCLQTTKRDWVQCGAALRAFRKCHADEAGDPNHVLVLPKLKSSAATEDG